MQTPASSDHCPLQPDGPGSPPPTPRELGPGSAHQAPATTPQRGSRGKGRPVCGPVALMKVDILCQRRGTFPPSLRRPGQEGSPQVGTERPPSAWPLGGVPTGWGDRGTRSGMDRGPTGSVPARTGAGGAPVGRKLWARGALFRAPRNCPAWRVRVETAGYACHPCV